MSLLLPVSTRAATQAPAVAPVPGTQIQAGAAIPMCEDDDDVAALVVDMQAQLGHVPTRMRTAAALGALADGRAVDLLFTDVLCPAAWTAWPWHGKPSAAARDCRCC